MNLELSRQIFETPSNIKFHENPSSGSRVVPRKRTDRRTDMMKISRFRNFANAPKNDDNGWCSQNVFSVSTIMTDSQMKTSYPVSHYTVLSDVTELHAGTLPKTYGSLKCLRADLRLPLSPKIKKRRRGIGAPRQPIHRSSTPIRRTGKCGLHSMMVPDLRDSL